MSNDHLMNKLLGRNRSPVLTPEDSQAVLDLAAISFMMMSAQKSKDLHAVNLLTKIAEVHFERIPHLARLLKPRVEHLLQLLTQESSRIESGKL